MRIVVIVITGFQNTLHKYKHCACEIMYFWINPHSKLFTHIKFLNRNNNFLSKVTTRTFNFTNNHLKHIRRLAERRSSIKIHISNKPTSDLPRQTQHPPYSAATPYTANNQSCRFPPRIFRQRKSDNDETSLANVARCRANIRFACKWVQRLSHCREASSGDVKESTRATNVGPGPNRNFGPRFPSTSCTWPPCPSSESRSSTWWQTRGRWGRFRALSRK